MIVREITDAWSQQLNLQEVGKKLKFYFFRDFINHSKADFFYFFGDGDGRGKTLIN